MNFAFSALLILSLAVPGLVLLWVYRAERGRPASRGPLTDDIPLALVISALLHAAWVGLFNRLGSTEFVRNSFAVPNGVHVDIKSAVDLLSAQSGRDGVIFEAARCSITNGPYPFFVLVYFLSLACAAALVGFCAKKAVRSSGIDKTFSFLRWNDWFYLLQGESPDDLALQDDKPEAHNDGNVVVKIAAVVGDYLICGLLADYIIDREGNLDSIVLVQPQRRKLGEKEDPEGKAPRPPFFDINADFLVLKYKEIANLAISRGLLVPQDQMPPPEPLSAETQTPAPPPPARL